MVDSCQGGEAGDGLSPSPNLHPPTPIELPVFRNVLGEKLGARRFGGLEIPGGKTVADEIASKLIEGALGGDLKFIKEVLDRYEGRPRPIDPIKGGGINARDAQELRLSEAEEIVRVRRAEESQGGP